MTGSADYFAAAVLAWEVVLEWRCALWLGVAPADLAAEVPEADPPDLELEEAWREDVEDFGAVAPGLASAAEALWRCVVVDECSATGAGSATRRRRPGSTRVPEGIEFQRRSWLSETPKRSAMVTRVSPRRAT